MDSAAEEAQSQLNKMRNLRERFGIRASSLPADLALAGLVDDLLASAAAALVLPEDSTSVMYPLIRTAFEAAQRIVVLATDDDYLRIGTRAWLYYQRKDVAVFDKTEPERAARWLEAVVAQVRSAWLPHCPEADTLLASENAWLEARGRKPPDNFLGRDLAEVVQERHGRVFGGAGPVPKEMKSVNRGIYAALSRESHARLRVEPAALVVSSTGIVEIIPRALDEPGRRRTALGCLDLSLVEAAGGLSFLLRAREHEERKKVQSAAAAIEESLPPGFKPDLGLHLARSGSTATSFHFLDVPIHKLGILPEGLSSWSGGIVLGDQEFIATFDVPAALLPELAAAIGLPLERLKPAREIVKHTLEGPPRVNVECGLGEVQRNPDQTFLPLIVTRLMGARGHVT